MKFQSYILTKQQKMSSPSSYKKKSDVDTNDRKYINR